MDLNPDLGAPDKDWEPIELHNEYGIGQSYVHGEPTGIRHRVAYYRRSADGSMVGRVWFGPGCEGAHGQAHGGAIAALLDELSGGSAWMSGHPSLAAELTVRFLHRVPLGVVLEGEGKVESQEGRKIRANAELRELGGRVLATASNLLIEVDPNKLTGLSGNTLPWQRPPLEN